MVCLADNVAHGEIGPWATHQPVLLAACAATDGPVLECGCGYNSTILLHAVCAPRGRPLLTLDGSAMWIGEFRSLARVWHSLEHVQDWSKPPLWNGGFDVALVDHDIVPRGPLVALLRDKVKYVVMHDSECGYCGYTEPLKAFDWCWTMKRYEAWTTIAGVGVAPPWIADALSPGDWGIPRPYRG